MATQTKAGPGRKAKAGANAGRIEAAQTIRGFVQRHDEVIRYLNGVRLIAALHRVRSSHRPRSGATIQLLFADAAEGEFKVQVRMADGTPLGALVLDLDFLEFNADDMAGGRARICRVRTFEDGAWVDAILAEAAACFAGDESRLTIKPGRRAKAAV